MLNLSRHSCILCFKVSVRPTSGFLSAISDALCRHLLLSPHSHKLVVLVSWLVFSVFPNVSQTQICWAALIQRHPVTLDISYYCHTSTNDFTFHCACVPSSFKCPIHFYRHSKASRWPYALPPIASLPETCCACPVSLLVPLPMSPIHTQIDRRWSSDRLIVSFPRQIGRKVLTWTKSNQKEPSLNTNDSICLCLICPQVGQFGKKGFWWTMFYSLVWQLTVDLAFHKLVSMYTIHPPKPFCCQLSEIIPCPAKRDNWKGRECSYNLQWFNKINSDLKASTMQLKSSGCRIIVHWE